MSGDVEGDHRGLSLILDLPGRRESIFVRSSDLGRKLWSNVQTLAAMHRIKVENCQCLRPDGSPLLLDERLSVQGLHEGAILRVCEALRQRKHETVLEDDLSTQEVPVEYGIKPYLWSKEEREEKARELKKKANELLKAAAFAEARDMYSVALAWLPPGESDVELVGALFANRSLVHIKLERWEDAQADAEQSLQLVPTNLKVQFRSGLAAMHLGDLDKAAACFRTVLEKDPEDLAVQRALLAVRKRAEAEEVEPVAKEEVKETPLALKWRVDLWQRGYSLPRLQYVWRDLNTSDHIDAWAHAWRHQGPLEVFFREGLRGLVGSHGPMCAVVLGTGSMAAATAVSGVADLLKLTVLEPSKRLAQMAVDVFHGVDIVQSPGQLDADVAIPASAFGMEQAAHVLLCDRISEDLVGERLIPSMKAGLDAAKRQHVRSLHCLPSRAELFCVPLDLRCSECLGFDASAGNALRFTMHSRDLPPVGARQWACSSCSWRNVPQVKVCELCRAARPKSSFNLQYNTRKQESKGCWPIDLEAEMRSGHICRFMGKEQLLCAWDFDESFQDRIVEHTFDVEAVRSGHVNAIAVWWRLMSPSSTLDTGPHAASWPSKRQAVFHLGYEIGIEKGEQLQFRMHFSEEQSRISFEMLKPRLVDRLGLMKFQVDILNEAVLDAIRSKLDVKTNRLTCGVEGTPLKRRDKLLSFGPFDLLPGTLSSELWRKVKERLRRHAERPRRGDEPIRCVFQHGTFEGTRRWPLPTLRDGATVPRLASFFERFAEASLAPYAEALKSYIQELPGSRVLELNCGPVPLLSMCAAEAGARAWALETIPELRDLALETVRNHGLEMVFEQKGLSNYRFFGGKMPGDPSVRVQKASLATATKVGDPKFLDGGRADIIACRPEAPLGLDYLETMWYASEELLRPGGRLLPPALVTQVSAVEWMPWLDGSIEATRLLQPIFSQKQEVLKEHLTTLSSEVNIIMDLAARHEPVYTEHLEVEREGVFTAFALCHQPYFGAETGNERYVTVFFVTPQTVQKGQRQERGRGSPLNYTFMTAS